MTNATAMNMKTNMKPVSLPRALWRGFTMRCPHCGEGKMFGRFLKVANHCPVCGEEFFHHRADDFPAYLVMVVIGHLFIPSVLLVEVAFSPPIWLQYLIWLPLIAFGALALLQPTKGAVVALQWHLGMHGFEDAKKRRDLAAETNHRWTNGVVPAPSLALHKR
jgi:uncharacterized protein (DUF983 family)